MRAFIAVQLPVELKAKLAALQQALQSSPVEAAWVREAGFHITLKFLGQLDPTQIEPVVSCMSETARRYHPFSLTLCGVGVFPHESAPRVLRAGIQDATGLLSHLQRTLEAHLAQIGYIPENHPFTPHLTLARLKRVSRRGAFLSCLKAHQQSIVGRLDVGHIALVESQLHASGARYATVKTVRLSGAPDSL